MSNEFKTKPMLVSHLGNTLALREDGTVWAWGHSDSGIFGIPDSDAEVAYSSIPKQIPGPNGTGHFTNVISIGYCRNTSAVLCSDGSLWMWGKNEQGQCGVGSDNEWIEFPTQVKGINGEEFLENITNVSVNANRAFALDSNGAVFGWGYDYNIKLDEQTFKRSTPELFLKNIINISGSMMGALALCADKTVYGWESLHYIGVGKSIISYSPRPGESRSAKHLNHLEAAKVTDESNRPIQNIVTIHDTFAISEDGSIYSWGKTDYGQTGTGLEVGEDLFKAKKVIDTNNQELKNIVSLTGTVSHFAITEDSKVYCWGDNRYGSLGLAEPDSINKATRNDIFDDKYALYSFGELSFVVEKDATVWAFGAYSLGIDEEGEPLYTHEPQQIFLETGDPFLLFGEMEVPPDPGPEPGPGPDPKPGNDCNCCCCRPVINYFTGPVTIQYDGCSNCCGIQCDDKPEV